MFAGAGIMSSSYNAAVGLVPGASDHQSGNGNAMPVHAFVGVPAGALLLIMTSINLSGADCTVSSSPSLTWDPVAKVDCSDTSVEIHTAIFTAGGSINVTPNWADPTNAFSLCQIVTGQESSLGGATLAVTRAQAPSFGEGCSGDLLTTRANSIIFGVVGDRSSVAGTITYIGTPTQLFAQQAAGPFFYTFYKNAPTATTYTLGMSSPNTGAAMGLCLIEIRTP